MFLLPFVPFLFSVLSFLSFLKGRCFLAFRRYARRDARFGEDAEECSKRRPRVFKETPASVHAFPNRSATMPTNHANKPCQLIRKLIAATHARGFNKPFPTLTLTICLYNNIIFYVKTLYFYINILYVYIDI